MSTPFQNRLVGTIIVAAAAIIFLPDIFDGEKKTHQADFEDIPQSPAFKSAVDKKPFPVDKLVATDEAELSDETALDDTPSGEVAVNNLDGDQQIEVFDDAPILSSTTTDDATSGQTPPSPAITENESKRQEATTALPEIVEKQQAWVIQLGSFRHQKNVQDLVQKLKQNGYTAFTKPIKTKSGVLTKVFVGPELSKQSLEEKLPKLKDLTKVQGKIARFSPTK